MKKSWQILSQMRFCWRQKLGSKHFAIWASRPRQKYALFWNKNAKNPILDGGFLSLTQQSKKDLKLLKIHSGCHQRREWKLFSWIKAWTMMSPLLLMFFKLDFTGYIIIWQISYCLYLHPFFTTFGGKNCMWKLLGMIIWDMLKIRILFFFVQSLAKTLSTKQHCFNNK